ncbi:uncharacterized protein [Apostichopus japonicus]|uniref:uncharacterized protein isoform X3 n=1 Tax=Stichopus japonicus TaxID=307972 RepID=UPI003AB4FFF9
MGGCSALRCTNRSEKGFKMFKYPSDPARRKVWEDKVNREGWTSSRSSCLCEVNYRPKAHFDNQQFENKRVDGKIKLRPFAVPTIFPHHPEITLSKIPKRKPPVVKRVEIPLSTMQKQVCIHDHTYILEPNSCPVVEPPTNAEPSESQSVAAADNSCLMIINEITDRTVKKRIIELEAKITSLKSILIKTKESLRVMEKRTVQEREGVSKLFGADQLECLRRGSLRGVEWSPATLKKAQQIRVACGASGYQFLIKHNFPLPSRRTLERRLKKKAPVQRHVLGQALEELEGQRVNSLRELQLDRLEFQEFDEIEIRELELTQQSQSVENVV